MTKNTEQAYRKIVDVINDESDKLQRHDYIDLVGKLSEHIQLRKECIADETEGHHP